MSGDKINIEISRYNHAWLGPWRGAGSFDDAITALRERISVLEYRIVRAGENAIKQLAEAEAERDRSAARAEGYHNALVAISFWRKDSHDYDDDMGHDHRDFGDEDWDAVEAYAKEAAAQPPDEGGEDENRS